MEEGQRVNLTLLDFGLDSPGSDDSIFDDSVTGCRVYATIKEEVRITIAKSYNMHEQGT